MSKMYWNQHIRDKAYDEGYAHGKAEYETHWSLALDEVIPPQADIDTMDPLSVAAYIQSLLTQRDDKPFADGCGDMRCQECSRYTPVYRVPDETWAIVMGAPNAPGILCIICFIRRAEEKGVATFWTLRGAK